jgi:hypothetical protein
MARADVIREAVKSHPVKHLGFKGAQSKVESEGYDPKSAGAIIAAATRNASARAKANNPRLKKVKG